jgi:hypothetical protein
MAGASGGLQDLAVRKEMGVARTGEKGKTPRETPANEDGLGSPSSRTPAKLPLRPRARDPRRGATRAALTCQVRPAQRRGPRPPARC